MFGTVFAIYKENDNDMETEIIKEDYHYVLYDAEGNESEPIYGENMLKDMVKKGKFKVKIITGWDGRGPSSWVTYRTEEHKIAKVLKITYKHVKETEEIEYGLL